VILGAVVFLSWKRRQRKENDKNLVAEVHSHEANAREKGPDWNPAMDGYVGELEATRRPVEMPAYSV
jgi:hypothetical protein